MVQIGDYYRNMGNLRYFTVTHVYSNGAVDALWDNGSKTCESSLIVSNHSIFVEHNNIIPHPPELDENVPVNAVDAVGYFIEQGKYEEAKAAAITAGIPISALNIPQNPEFFDNTAEKAIPNKVEAPSGTTTKGEHAIIVIVFLAIAGLCYFLFKGQRL